VALGASGVPVFAGGHGGLPWLLGPTGGYLLAAPAVAFVVGGLSGGLGAGTMRLLGALLAGLAVLYLGGVSHLFVLTGEDPGALLALGVLPFLGGDAVKVILALLLAGWLRKTSLGRL